jgi:hypothetical protein
MGCLGCHCLFGVVLVPRLEFAVNVDSFTSPGLSPKAIHWSWVAQHKYRSSRRASARGTTVCLFQGSELAVRRSELKLWRVSWAWSLEREQAIVVWLHHTVREGPFAKRCAWYKTYRLITDEIYIHYCMSTFEDWPFLGFHAMQYVKSTLMMEVKVSFETSVQFCQNAQRRISYDH